MAGDGGLADGAAAIMVAAWLLRTDTVGAAVREEEEHEIEEEAVVEEPSLEVEQSQSTFGGFFRRYSLLVTAGSPTEEGEKLGKF